MTGYLSIHETDCPVRVVAIAGVVTIGRTLDNTITLLDDLVSRAHAMIQQQGANTLLLDLDSTNGTFVNDELVYSDEPICLHDGDVITIGHASLRYTLNCVDDSLGRIMVHEGDFNSSERLLS